ncbi:hypothetical protein BS17DRAFT_780349 [Gyrodon lividus]|nr:hypothetical protein BS17DRAFT_780349 [Gyrodon lividus]
MHVKESVKEFVHDVKRRFSHHHKHKRGESSSSAHTHDGTSSSYSTADSNPGTPEHSNPSSPAPSQPGTPESSRFSTFIRPRTPSTPSKKHHHNVLHKIRRRESKRSRLVSAPSLPSGLEGNVYSSNHERAISATLQDDEEQLGDRHRETTVQTPRLIVTGPEESVVKPKSTQETVDEHRTIGSSQEDYANVINISSQSDTSESSAPEGEYVDLLNAKHEYDSDHVDHDAVSHSQQSDTRSQSDVSGTLITAASGPDDHEKSVSESDSHFEVDLNSDGNLDRSSSVYESSSQLPGSAVSTEQSIPELTFDIQSDAVPTSTSTPAPIAKDQPQSEPMAQDPGLPPRLPSKSVESESITGSNQFVLDDSEGTGPLADSKDRGTDADAASPEEEEIALAQSLLSGAHSPVPTSTPAVNLNKPTPTRPLSPPAHPQPPRTPAQPTRTTSGSPAPIYIPRLTAPSMFLPIPNTDPLSALLTKYVSPEQRPRRDVTGEYSGRDVHEMVMSNSWRALARMARDRIVASDPEDLGRILDLWSLRLASLARLRLTNQASAECTNLFAVLNAVPFTSVPGAFPGSGSLPASIPLPSSPANAASLPLSPAGLGRPTQLPATPSAVPPSSRSTSGPAFPLASAPAPAHPARNTAGELVHPFELMVFHARVHYWAGDTLGYVDALSGLLGRCKERARGEGWVVMQQRRMEAEASGRREGMGSESGEEQEAEEEEESEEDERVSDEGEEDAGTAAESEMDEGGEEPAEQEEEQADEILVAAEANLSMWLERAARLCLILASQMIEMKDYQAAINLLVPLCTQRAPSATQPTPSPALHSTLGRVYLLSGNLNKAADHFEVVASSASQSGDGKEMVVMNIALMSVALGDWDRAEEALTEVVANEPGNFTAVNNLAVTLLSQGRIKEGIDLLESALKASPSTVAVAEPFLFNLSTLHELRSATAIDKKRELLIEVAKWNGDGLKTACLKMPAN